MASAASLAYAVEAKPTPYFFFIGQRKKTPNQAILKRPLQWDGYESLVFLNQEQDEEKESHGGDKDKSGWCAGNQAGNCSHPLQHRLSAVFLSLAILTSVR